jgi:hypothetical protein
LDRLLNEKWGGGRELGCFVRMFPGVRRIVVWEFRDEKTVDVMTVVDVPVPINDSAYLERHDLFSGPS